MDDPRLADHEMGVELQIVELVEQRERARVQGRADDADRFQRDIDALQLELARTAEQLTTEAGHSEIVPPAQHA
jgi:hypothetical protein